MKLQASFNEKRRWPTGKMMMVKLTTGNGGTCTISASFLTRMKHCNSPCKRLASSPPTGCMELAADGPGEPVKLQASFSKKRQWRTEKTMMVKLMVDSEKGLPP
ncbi:hypothetical protein SESBI_31011 [Sesbania bispinosa]|nr:hypothetical protein SESBI_31011 [Sesbania bispinosa]